MAHLQVIDRCVGEKTKKVKKSKKTKTKGNPAHYQYLKSIYRYLLAMFRSHDLHQAYTKRCFEIILSLKEQHLFEM